VVQLRLHRTQARLDIAQRFAVGQLRKGHAKELIPAREAADPTVPAVATHAGIERPSGDPIHQLRKHDLSVVHQPLLERESGSTVRASSSRARSRLDVNDC